MRENPAVVALVFAARDGDREAWDRLVERYAPLVYGICRTYRLAPADAEDVGQTVWMLLFEHLHRLRHPRPGQQPGADGGSGDRGQRGSGQ